MKILAIFFIFTFLYSNEFEILGIDTNSTFDEFCDGNASFYASLKKINFKKCKKNLNFTKIGYGAIVIANDLNISNLTKLELKKILSTKIQNRGDMIENPYQFLNQINSKFPKIPIKIYSNLDKNQKEILQNFIGELKNTKKPNFADKNGIFLLSFADFYNKNNGLKLAFINDINPNKKNIKSLFYPLSYPLFLGENNETNSTKNHLEIAEILGIIR